MYKVRAFQKVLTYKYKDRIIQLSYFSNGCTMKERLTYFLFISLFCCNVFAQNVEYVTYCEDFVSRPSAIHYTPLRAKAMRKSSNHGGQITVSYNSPMNLPSSGQMLNTLHAGNNPSISPVIHSTFSTAKITNKTQPIFLNTGGNK